MEIVWTQQALRALERIADYMGPIPCHAGNCIFLPGTPKHVGWRKGWGTDGWHQTASAQSAYQYFVFCAQVLFG